MISAIFVIVFLGNYQRIPPTLHNVMQGLLVNFKRIFFEESTITSGTGFGTNMTSMNSGLSAGVKCITFVFIASCAYLYKGTEISIRHHSDFE